MHQKRASEYRKYHREGHDRVGEEGEDACFDEEPVLFLAVDRVAKVRPDEYHQYADKFLPERSPFKLDPAECHI